MILIALFDELSVSLKSNSGEPAINTKIPNVLVIDSNERDGIKISSALEGAGYMVVCARDGLEGIEKLTKTSFDIIVMDCALPKAFGEDARVRIRQASYLPIIVIGENYDVAESLELGADAFMPRPPVLRELVARVKSLLDRTSALAYRNPASNVNTEIMDDFSSLTDDDSYFQRGNR